MARWNESVNVADLMFDPDTVPLTELRDGLVAAFRNASWYNPTRVVHPREAWFTVDCAPLAELLDEMAAAEDWEWLNVIWDLVLDWADAERVWVEQLDPSWEMPR